MKKILVICDDMLKYLAEHPKSLRVDIEMALVITSRKFDDCRGLLGKRVVSEKVKMQYYFSLASDVETGDQHG